MSYCAQAPAVPKLHRVPETHYCIDNMASLCVCLMQLCAKYRQGSTISNPVTKIRAAVSLKGESIICLNVFKSCK